MTLLVEVQSVSQMAALSLGLLVLLDLQLLVLIELEVEVYEPILMQVP